jgi:hypothetical protein
MTRGSLTRSTRLDESRGFRPPAKSTNVRANFSGFAMATYRITAQAFGEVPKSTAGLGR